MAASMPHWFALLDERDNKYAQDESNTRNKKHVNPT
jgi:hypothetical protein